MPATWSAMRVSAVALIGQFGAEAPRLGEKAKQLSGVHLP
ncbi:hypothetical protein JOE48_001843 [Methylobacterium sp. PvR107]|nr:hypothetical protein [Methylobacterium sp. PvR107]